MKYVGVDLHKHVISVCVVIQEDNKRKVVARRNLAVCCLLGSWHGTPSSYHRGGTWRIERSEVRHRTIGESLGRDLPDAIIGTWKPEESAAATIIDSMKSSARRAT